MSVVNKWEQHNYITLQMLDIETMVERKCGYKFELSKPGRKSFIVDLLVYPPDGRLCVKTNTLAGWIYNCDG